MLPVGVYRRRAPITQRRGLRVSLWQAPDVNSLTMTAPRLVQRSGANGSFNVSGTYGGATADAVQVKVFLASDDSTVVDWADVDATLAGGTWSGSVTVPTGGPYYAQARLHNSGDSVLASTASSSTFIVGDVFVCIGQSNMQGQGTNTQSYTGSSLWWLQRETGSIDETGNDPWSTEGSSGSMGPLLMSLVSAHVGASVPIATVVQVKGNTQLYGDTWEPPSGAEWVDTDTLVDGLDLNGILAVLWLQGENDAAAAVSQANYQASEQTLATAVNAWPGSPPLISINLAEYNSSVDVIRRAKVANWDSGDTLHGGSFHDIDLTDGGGDGVHYKTDAELAQLAGRVWLSLEDAVYSGANGRGPRVSAATFSGTNIDVTFDKDLDTNDTTYATAAWTVNDNGGPATVSSVTRQNTRKVRVTCASTLAAPVTFTFAELETAKAVTIPKTSPISLPATINSLTEVPLIAEQAFDYAAAAATGLAGFPFRCAVFGAN